MILLIDNYDSFVYNLAQYLGELRARPMVYRNDEITLRKVKRMNPDYIIISPGPKTPKEAGMTCRIIEYFAEKIPILGVCLGHQAIAEVFGARVIRAKEVVHGKVSLIFHKKKTIFKGIKNPFPAARYHSLIVERESIPDTLELTAWTEDGLVMGIRHRIFRVEGVQFHPESILTKQGKKILKNFLETYKKEEGCAF
jgi:anthranilate synthase/aminodeoxychorismate synthase-like glutamine amidotransferase|uniref:Aminodeoxychorismate/anthranilate synthase component II n=1 Tax=candidate division WOR-3 bacterium TaxID=2052148 RepID=A0A7V3RHA7_UNCW3